MRKVTAIASLVGVLTVAACDEFDSDLERAAIGAAVGCLAGEVLVNGRCVEGAVVGGAAGVITN